MLISPPFAGFCQPTGSPKVMHRRVVPALRNTLASIPDQKDSLMVSRITGR